MFSIFHIRQERGFVRHDRRRLGSDSYYFVWVRFGQSHYELRGRTYVCRKNELLLIPAGCPGFELKGDGGIRDLITVQFSPSASEASGLLPLLAAKAPLHWASHMPELVLEKLLLLEEQWTERGPYFSVMCAALLMEVLVIVSREVDEGEKAPSAVQHTERMKRYIDEHYRDKITKVELGAVTGVSPNYAAAIFRKVTGLTISEFVHMKRLKTAQYLLRHSQLTVHDISEQLGYSDPSYFIRTFKRVVGKLPSDLIAERTARE
ncbi:helix-turn-helix transcriptional regulator [Paenibacillus spongiae]|uniref:AraC family transcriptional regulator n=1 Tax=Paenibacillus spongiae TaxID=2909671 RepID=A0ABY5SAV2_9BACL|nr:AraC family transcriptional regulator [Paenibacillus spongiae]UVI30874.1 AraC family transcriptional regulator [Paenibacillus spongiae]